MNRRAPLAVASLLVACFDAAGGRAQGAGTQRDAEAATISGTVIDSVSRRPVAQAFVHLRGSSISTVTGLTGTFVVRAAALGSAVLEVRRIGYEPFHQELTIAQPDERLNLTIALRPLAFRLAEVTVAPGSFAVLDAATVSKQALSRAEIETLPFGEDIFRAVTRLPGLTPDDYGAHFSIRGGRRDETLVLLDGLELYEPFHLKDFDEGALSIVDVEAVDGVELLTGGFPAHYGDKRSGVMSITSRTPREDGVHATFGASFTNAHGLAEGAFANRKGSWLLSGRRGYIDLVLRMINKKETQAPAYGDVFGTVRYKLHPNHALAASVLHASDHYKFSIAGTTGFNDSIPSQEAANNSYGDTYAWTTLRSIFGAHLSLTTLLSTGSVHANRRGDEHHALKPLEFYGVEGNRGFTFSGVKQDFRYQAAERMVLDWGYDARSLRAHFDWTNRVTANPDDPTPDTTGFYPRLTRRTKKASGTTVGAYVSDRFQVFQPLTLELGVRYDAASYTGDRDWSPRLHALYQLSPSNTVRGGWGQYRQRQGIADENAFDKLTRYFPSELSRQWTLGFEHQYPDGGSFRAEAYYKKGSRLRPILRNWKTGLNVFPESAEDRILVYPDSSMARGIELYDQHSLGRRVNLRLGYALSFVDEHVSRIDQVNDPLKPAFNPKHPSPLDQRHALNLDVRYRLSNNWTLTSALTYHSGRPYTYEIGVPVTKRNGAMGIAVRPESLYAKRLPPYQRADLRLTRRKLTANSEFRFFFEVINLTNRENVLGYDVFTVRNSQGALQLVRDTETWFSILPSLGVTWSKRF